MQMREIMNIVREGAATNPAKELQAVVSSMKLPARVSIYPLRVGGDVAEVTDLESSEPGNGQGRTTMQAVCSEADRLGVTLWANPMWDEDVDGALSNDELIDWYVRLGFTDSHESDDVFYMVRKPRGAVQQ